MEQHSFRRLTTVKFQERMKPPALRIYQKIFQGCHLEDLRGNGIKVHVLDKEFGIDSILHFHSGQWITIQEKYRKHRFLKYGDFTQEYMNAVGTEHESEGEWFKLGAQLYFYGWSNAEETDFERWLLLHVSRYKLLIEHLGGIERVGLLKQNETHGRASFYAIPLHVLKPVILFHNLPSAMLEKEMVAV